MKIKFVSGLEHQQDDVEAKVVIFKDTGFQSDKDKTNAMQILKRFGIEEVNSI